MMSVSLDGYVAGTDGDLSWHRVDDELHTHFNDVLGRMGGFLNGRVMYELMAAVWPTADPDPASTPPMVEFARIWRDMPKVVYSKTFETTEWNTTVVREVVPGEVRALKEQQGGDLAVGGVALAHVFLEQDLVDELRLYLHPVLVGEGKQLFPAPGPQLAWDLVETRPFGEGVVLLRYVRAAKPAAADSRH